MYEARDIDQRLGSEDKIDAWFEAKTRGLNDWQKDELKKHWGTMQKVLSSKSRIDRVVSDIVFDFSVKLRKSPGLRALYNNLKTPGGPLRHDVDATAIVGVPCALKCPGDPQAPCAWTAG